MNNTPKISLIMSVYNGEDYLYEAVESVVNQTFKDWELIVINDCSTDSTAEILNDFAQRDARIRVYTNEVNLRLPSSLNRALEIARGIYIGRMDADDICLPDRLQKQYDFMQAHPHVALSSCRFMTLKKGVIASGGCGGRSDCEAIKALLLVTNPVLHPGIIARAEVIRRLKYDPNFTCTEDMELWTRFVMEGYTIEILPDYLMIYRLHDKQITKTTLEKQHREVLAVQKRYCAKFLEEMDPEREHFYITGVYFRENTDISGFCEFCRWLQTVNRKTGSFDPDALRYAMFEILAEYKRKGITKAELAKGMLSLGLPFLAKELLARRKRARRDGRACVESAGRVGLVQRGGTVTFPIFSNPEHRSEKQYANL